MMTSEDGGAIGGSSLVLWRGRALHRLGTFILDLIEVSNKLLMCLGHLKFVSSLLHQLACL